MIDRSRKRGDPFYLSKPWKELRLKALRRDRYMCQKCGIACIGKARNAPSPHVDHIVPRKVNPDLELQLSNLRTLCPSCHSRITMADIHGNNKPEIGIDGYPIETK